MRCFISFFLLSALLFNPTAKGQESTFWQAFEAYEKNSHEVHKKFDINAYASEEASEIRESTYGELSYSGADFMIKLPEGTSIANKDWAIQIINPNKTVVVTKPLADPSENQFNYLEFLQTLRNEAGLTIIEEGNYYRVRSEENVYGKFRSVEWQFAKQPFDILKTVIVFNRTNLTDNTAEGGTGEDYTLKSPRLEIIYKNAVVEVITINDVIITKGDQLKLAQAYSEYSIIDLTERYETKKN